MKLQIRLRESDKVLREYFEKIKPGDQAHEARRLMMIGLSTLQKRGVIDIVLETAEMDSIYEESDKKE
jgi:hypothetical protein